MVLLVGCWIPSTVVDVTSLDDPSTIVNGSGRLGAVTSSTGLPLRDVGATAACCSPITGGALDAEDAQRLARVFKALGDPTRVRLLSLIAAQPEREACICDLTDPVGLSQPTVSHHMKQLVDAGLVVREQRGRWAYYRLVEDTLSSLSSALEPGA
jgi:ArsR family transcriptional regulator